MFEKLEIFKMAQGLATHAGERQSVVARNVANADTPGYRAKDIADFATTYRRTGDDLTLRTTRRGHLSAGEAMQRNGKVVDSAASEEPNGNTVSLEEEMLKAADVRREHDLALAVYRSSLGILRTSLGRAR